MEFDDLVRQALKLGNLKQAEFASVIGVSQATVSKWLSGKAKPEIHHWLAVRSFMAHHGYADGETVPTVPLQGFVGAGAVVLPLEGDGALEYIEPAFPMPAGTVCVQVRGDSMYPRYQDGETIYFRAETANPADLVGRESVVKLVDGRMLVKIIRKGTAANLYRLESWNAPPIEDVEIAFASQVFFVDRR